MSRAQPKLNQLLAAIPEAEFRRLSPELEYVDLALGTSLYEPGSHPKHVYFPTNAIVSLLQVTESGATAEIAIAGREGFVGVGVFLGGINIVGRATVQGSGGAVRINADAALREFKRAGTMQRLLLAYVQALMVQIAQTAICNRHHTLHQQLARWLLVTLDRSDSNELQMTQQLIAEMLGVRREGVTAAARKLQSAGWIRYSRGRIQVLDRHGLESNSCECYNLVKQQYEQLLH